MVSRQKIYNSLLCIKEKYHTFENVVLFVSYVPCQGIRLNVRIEPYARRSSWITNCLEVTDCLYYKSMFEIADAITSEIEIWLKRNDLYSKV